MEVSADRAQSIGILLFIVRTNLRKVDVEELEVIIADAQLDKSIGPIVNPGKWEDIELAGQVDRTIEILRKVIELKQLFEGGQG